MLEKVRCQLNIVHLRLSIELFPSEIFTKPWEVCPQDFCSQ